MAITITNEGHILDKKLTVQQGGAAIVGATSILGNTGITGDLGVGGSAWESNPPRNAFTPLHWI